MKLFYKNFPKTVSLLAGILLTGLLIPISVTAQHNDFSFDHHDIDADVTDRLHHRDAEYAMTTNEGSVEMLLTNDAILMQFSDQFLDDLEDEIHDEEENYDYEEASVLADVFKSMITSGVRKLLDHAITIPIHEIQEVYYDDGRIYIINHDGEEIFGDLEIDDTDVMEDFSRRDARRFVSALERRMY